MIAIVNYGSGNIRAIANIYERLTLPHKIVSQPGELIGSEKIILPGVGAFDETISLLSHSGFRTVLDNEVLINKTPVLGICVGMQILGEQSEEGSLPGLGWIKGTVRKIDTNRIQSKPKIPHLGWNSIKALKANGMFNDVDEEQGFYFMHSFYFECNDENDVMSSTFYGTDFASAVNHQNIYGVQFHPEKSHENGITLLKNFAAI
ncbi:MAG: imidazole glycerol phosphate synthase subunit HisH [Chitinophagaceae bacterium]